MSRLITATYTSLFALLLAFSVSMPAQAASSACQTIDDAYKKQMMSPVHAQITRTSTGAMKGRYGMIYGPDSGGTTCSSVRDEAVNGEAATVYRQQHKSGSETYDTLLWVSKKSGMPLRQEQDADLGHGQKGHETLVFKYTK